MKMELKNLTEKLCVSPQLSPADVASIAVMGFKSIVCNRPDGESEDQTSFADIEAAARELGLSCVYQPVEPGKIGDDQVSKFADAIDELAGPVLAYCRTGTRSATLWALSEGKSRPVPDILLRAKAAGFDLASSARRIANGGRLARAEADLRRDVVIVGGGAAGIATASSLLKRSPGLSVTIIDPAETHYYQPGWTLVGAGVFESSETARPMANVIPRGVEWIKRGVVAFEPENDCVILEGCYVVQYKRLIVAPGLKLNWAGIEGLEETLGKNGVTSNYRYDLAPYTWELVRNFARGRAVFTQPLVPIKCAGAPQKVMYLSADHWRRFGRLGAVDIEFDLAGAALFGVPDYVPALMEYVRKYNIKLNFGHTLTAVDGPGHKAWFKTTAADGTVSTIETAFDLLHVTPPQIAPDFIRASALADQGGWCDVDHATLRHKKFSNVYSLGDVCSTPNAKTAAAARKQAPIVAQNLLVDMGLNRQMAEYDGYGSCPLTVERGKIVLAEFCYGGKLKPTFPAFLIDGTKPSRAAWILKEQILPSLYWNAMLKGREWMAKPKPISR
jgi:sulfide:quinone oxidoreductase